MDKGILVIADDFGLDVSVNKGISFGLKNNFITGASLMPVGKEFLAAAEALVKLADPLVGIHFVLVEEQGLVIKALPRNYKNFVIKYIFGAIKLEDIEKELRAQLNKCREVGIKPSFINSHQHLHLLPKILDVIIRLAKENNIAYIRTVREPIRLRGGAFRFLASLFLVFLSVMARRKIKKAGIETNDFFVGFYHAGNLQKEDVDLAFRLSQKRPNKIIELGSHPGFESEKLKRDYGHWGDYNWQRELDLLNASRP